MGKFSRWTRLWVACALTVGCSALLSGCPSDEAQESTPPASEAPLLAGIAVSGKASTGALVAVGGGSGVPRALHSGNGRFELPVHELVSPYVVQAYIEDADARRYQSVALDLEQRLNVTPFTELAMLDIIGADPTQFFDGLATVDTPASSDVSIFTAQAIEQSQPQVRRQVLRSVGFEIPEVGDFFTAAFSPSAGDPMFDAIKDLLAALKAEGKTFDALERELLQEQALCATESLSVEGSATLTRFCPESKETTADTGDGSGALMQFTSQYGERLQVTALGSAVLSVAWLQPGADVDAPSYACQGSSCLGVSLGAPDSALQRSLHFAGTVLAGAQGSITLDGSVLSATPGLPPLSCQGEPFYLNTADGGVLADCVSFGGGEMGGRRAIYRFYGQDYSRNLFVEVRAEAETVIDITWGHRDAETYQEIADYKCPAGTCLGAQISAPDTNGLRSFRLEDVALSQVQSDGSLDSSLNALLNAELSAFDPYGAEPYNCAGASELVTANVSGEGRWDLCPPYDLDDLGTVSGYQLDDGRLVYLFYNEDFLTTLTVTASGRRVDRVEYRRGSFYENFVCDGDDCEGVTISEPDEEDRRRIGFSASLLREIETGGLPGDRDALLDGELIAAPDCYLSYDC
jgi:hypothetical protein